MNKWLGLVFVLWLVLLTGCSAQRSTVTFLNKDAADANNTDEMVAAMINNDPAGPIPAPQLPPVFAAAPVSTPAELVAAPSSQSTKGGVPYSIRSSAENAPELLAVFERTSLLYRLVDTPPDTLTGLEQRLRVSLTTGQDILHSYGYYSGNVRGRIEGYKTSADAAPDSSTDVASADSSDTSPRTSNVAADSNPADTHGAQAEHPTQGGQDSRRSEGVVVRVVFTPGPQYHMGKSVVIRLTAPGAPDSARQPGETAASATTGYGTTGDGKSDSNALGNDESTDASLPKSLTDVGLPAGASAIADDVIAAVDRVRESFRNQGYPFAAIASTRYILDRETRSLEAEVNVSPGAFVRMGNIETSGPASVRQSYLEALRPWRPGDPWNQEQVEVFRERLRQSRLFQSVELSPAREDGADGLRPVLTTLVGAPEKTVGGVLKYDSDFGFGVQGYWENRNLTWRGDRLRVELPLWSDMQELFGTYRLPFFLRDDQTFIARAGVLNQKTDAFDLQSGAVAAGVERRFYPNWTGSFQGSAEAGSIRDPDQPRHDYMLLGVPMGVIYNNTGNLLDARSGGRVMFSVAPYTGRFNEDFSILRSRIDVQRFLPLSNDDTLVLALRGAYGTVTGANATGIPPSVRFYSGGGGSVRGYAFQSLGPRNGNDDPLGGASLVELGVESRWKISEEWGVVTFLDGGMAYEDSTPNMGDTLRWGTGVGLRYYTVIGPIRFDVATPLNPRHDDDPLQFYISIGQSF